MKKNIIFGLMFFCILYQNLQAQSDQKYQKALKTTDKAFDLMNKQDFDAAFKILTKALKIEPLCFEALQLKGDIMEIYNKPDSAVFFYKQSIATQNTNLRPMTYFLLARNELKIGQYADAETHLVYYVNHAKNINKPLVNRMLNTARFGAEAVQNPVDYELINIGDAINSKYGEYLPALTADESQMIFTVLRPADMQTKSPGAREEEDIYISENVNGKWQQRYPLGYPIKTGYNEGAHCISPDGKYLYYTMCNTDNGYGSCDLYWTKKVNGRWMMPKNMGNVVNTKYWESQPSVSADGKTIYFITNRPGGFGGIDIWKTEIISEGVFTPPVNLGNTINTEYDETAPYIHKDGKTLYFASAGHIGMGGLDIFCSELSQDGTWSKPRNLGYPINTYADEMNFSLNASGMIGFISSDKSGGYGGQDIYYFKMDERIRPIAVTYLKGKVYDKETKVPIKAKFELIDLETSEILTSSFSDVQNGEFLICLPVGKQLMLNVNKEQYLFYSDYFSIDTAYTQLKPYLKDIPLTKPILGEEIVLRNIFFDVNKSILKETSIQELQRLKKFLEENKNLKIEISGHTDNVGSESFNKDLSLNRAKAVYDYLIDQGISKDRLIYKGYGYSKPIADNSTEEGRAENRRTSFRIIGN